jgi:4-alpha-glucanotransferase
MHGSDPSVTPHPRAALRRLARYCGLKLDYQDLWGRHAHASDAALIGVLRALGVELHDPEQADGVLRRLRLERWRRPLEPVTVAWEGRPAAVRVRLPEVQARASLKLTIELEGGERLSSHAQAVDLDRRGGRTIDGESFVRLEWELPEGLPLGYHRMTLEVGGRQYHGHLIVAPMRAWEPEADSADARAWGVFLPIHALRTERSWGAADWTDFRRLIDWTEAQGGEVVATLPMLAGMLGNGPRGDEAGPFEFSPYAPASRLFPNEFYVDVESVPELAYAAEARALLESAAIREEIAALNGAELVDYRRQAALKRRVMEKLAAAFFESAPAERRAAFQRFKQRAPRVEDYANFRAAVEDHGCSWQVWPEPPRSGRLTAADVDPARAQYHLYAQWIAHEQLTALAERARQGGGGLYLDVPLGVHGDGYDAWRFRELFATGAGGGAPPDNFFVKGQNWGFPPLHPQRSREEGHRYLATAIGSLMEIAGVLRIDHVMGLHRLYWVPAGMEATEGVYVRYPAEEIYAVLTLESRRHATRVIGEDLGTVPRAVPAAMRRHGVQGMYVLQFSVQADGNHALAPVPAGAVASINTHDTPTFAGWWEGRDLDIQLEMGLIDGEVHTQAQAHRGHVRDSVVYFLRQRGLLAASGETGTQAGAVLAACLRWLAAEPAGMVLINLEDLWLEPLPQNVPGTGTEERPNWQRRASQPFGAWTTRTEYVKLLKEISELRRACHSRQV